MRGYLVGEALYELGNQQEVPADLLLDGLLDEVERVGRYDCRAEYAQVDQTPQCPELRTNAHTHTTHHAPRMTHTTQAQLSLCVLACGALDADPRTWLPGTDSFTCL